MESCRSNPPAMDAFTCVTNRQARSGSVSPTSSTGTRCGCAYRARTSPESEDCSSYGGRGVREETIVDQQDLSARQFGVSAANYLTSSVHATGADLERLMALAGQMQPARALD